MNRSTRLALTLGITGFFATAACASDASAQDALALWEADPSRIFQAEEVDLNDFSWAARPVIIFANSDRDPAFQQQMEMLLSDMQELVVRDVVVIVDTNPDAQSALRTKLRPRGFMVVLIGKDGQVVLRKPLPYDVRELSRTINKMPLRQQEIRERG